MVFQHFSLFEALTAAENIALSLDDGAPLSTISAKARDLSKAYGLPLDPEAMVGDLSVGERQRIEIIRCLLQQPDLIILDEPTSVLTPQEADKLFVTLERLRDEGKSILYISHRLEEVKRLCDGATVMRHGKVVGRCDPRKETAASLARMMVGADVKLAESTPISLEGAQELLGVCGLSRKPAGPFSMPLKDIWLSVRAGRGAWNCRRCGQRPGRIVRSAVGRGFAGKRRRRAHSRKVGRAGMDISARRKLGAAFVPEERLGHGAAPRMRLSENLLLSRHATDWFAFLRFGRIGVVREGAVQSAAQRVIQMMDVRKSAPDPEAAALSGGNLQKFIIGRELDRQPTVMIVNQPTWGVDAGAAARIRQALIELARAGSAVLVISQDLDELFEISDAIAVMHNGELSKPLPRAEATYERIGLLMGGAEPGHVETREIA